MKKEFTFIVFLIPIIFLILSPTASGLKVTGAPVDIMQDDLREGDRPFVTVTDSHSNFNPSSIDTIQVLVKGHVSKSVACNTIGTFSLSETGPNTRTFSGYLPALSYEDMWCYRGDQNNQWIEVSYRVGSTHNSDYAFLITKAPRVNDPCGPGYELRSDGLCYELGCRAGYELRSDGLCYEIVDYGGGCLIATATYGSELAPQVQQLRELRDNKLLQTESGTSFMNAFNDAYYLFSPVIADYERENPVFKEMVKVTITPMLSTLSIMQYAESESEVLGIGIGLILLNGLMYVGVPVAILVGIRRI